MLDGRTAACVVYAVDDAPAELLDALLARHVDVRVERDAYATVAALAEARPSNGQPRVPVVLILVEPSELPLLGSVLEVADRIAPGATLWRHASGDAQPLAAVTPAEKRSFRATDSGSSGLLRRRDDLAGSTGSGGYSAPRLRLAGGEEDGSGGTDLVHSHDPPNPGERSSDTSSGQRALSEDELRILLGTAPSEEQRTTP